MLIRTRFDIDQRVGIVDCNNHPGTIYQIRIDGKNLLYDVSYWVDKERKTSSFSEHELSETLNEVETL